MKSEAFKELLLKLDSALGNQLLVDLSDEELRSPQLYNAIGKYLERHKFTINAFEPEVELMDGLAVSLSAYRERAEQEREEERLYG